MKRSDFAPRGYSLIEILVVIALVAVLASFLMTRYAGHGTTAGGKTALSPIQRGRWADCNNNLSQVALALQSAAISAEQQPPQDIHEALRHGVTESMLRCPESRQPYHYDPATHLLSCPTPGHEDLARKVVGVE
jgi:prepilin-type N-terminal cleavage/methylation domain-containing protein